ncbi:unnamed protein product [Rangifer tarandus platyrhynchus]|uniref:Uncharacterized protein n=2 Tax=Rangifer tarandus platyrhynchus TaxID=3082113 RepID=A0ACB0DWB4_RANTA|nr:unnamed protein product [Rangifer tarandus platyrhynchus]CAI9692463.1 unnamed protein product [Rangifer tarandus platyrhynchus]
MRAAPGRRAAGGGRKESQRRSQRRGAGRAAEKGWEGAGGRHECLRPGASVFPSVKWAWAFGRTRRSARPPTLACSARGKRGRPGRRGARPKGREARAQTRLAWLRTRRRPASGVRRAQLGTVPALAASEIPPGAVTAPVPEEVGGHDDSGRPQSARRGWDEVEFHTHVTRSRIPRHSPRHTALRLKCPRISLALASALAPQENRAALSVSSAAAKNTSAGAR